MELTDKLSKLHPVRVGDNGEFAPDWIAEAADFFRTPENIAQIKRAVDKKYAQEKAVKAEKIGGTDFQNAILFMEKQAKRFDEEPAYKVALAVLLAYDADK